MNQPQVVLEPIPCAECAQSGRPDVVMRVVRYEHQWMNVSAAEPVSFYPGAVSIRTQRKKVPCALWRCPYGHRQETVLG